MKTYILLLLIVSSPLAWATTTTELVLDKPDRVYIDSDTLAAGTYADTKTSDNQGGVSQGQVWHQDQFLWRDGIGGSGWQLDVQQSDDWAGNSLLWGWTNATSSQLTWAADGTGTQLYTANDGSTISYAIGLPAIMSEHCVVNDPQSPPPTCQDLGGGAWVTNQVREQYVRYSQTRWRLQTGGRASRQSLFQLTGIATQVLDPRAQRPFQNVTTRPIPPHNVSMLAQTLPSDSTLWLALPDGANVDVTPLVDGQDFYLTQVTAQKYAPAILVNNQSLSSGTPEFCVGQCLQFALSFDPPPNLADQVCLWNLPGSPLNTRSQTSTNNSSSYQFDPNLLTNLTTTGWYAAGGGGQTCVGTGLSFSNGQYCALLAKGNFSLATPVFSGFQPSQAGFTWTAPTLQAVQQWQVSLRSIYDGNVGVTQLISGTNSNCNTGSAYWLDEINEIYGSNGNPPGQTYLAANPATHSVSFADSRSAVANPAATLNAAFTDYLRFRPAGQSNIWVTLATNSWKMDGYASLSGGLMRSNLPPASVLVQSTGLPVWTNVYVH